MTRKTSTIDDVAEASSWLRNYYFLRAAVSIAWVAAAFFVGSTNPSVAAALLVAYPTWDAFANLLDASRSGGLRANPSQAINAAVSVFTAIAVVIALGHGSNAVLAVFGAWAILAGLLQLAAAVRRWKLGAQWAMILSGAQSALAGIFFIKVASGTGKTSILDIAPYAAVGAFYFLVSAVWLLVKQTRNHRLGTVA